MGVGEFVLLGVINGVGVGGSGVCVANSGGVLLEQPVMASQKRKSDTLSR